MPKLRLVVLGCTKYGHAKKKTCTQEGCTNRYRVEGFVEDMANHERKGLAASEESIAATKILQSVARGWRYTSGKIEASISRVI